MKPELQIIVPGEPFPCERTRATAFMKDGKPKARVYTPERTTEYEERVAAFTRKALQRFPEWAKLAHTDAFFRVHIHWVTTQKGDKDNFEKAVLDGMKKANHYQQPPGKVVGHRFVTPRKVFVWGLIRDDSRVLQGLQSIDRTGVDTESRTEIVVETCNPRLEVPLWMQIAIERGWAPKAMMQGSVT